MDFRRRSIERKIEQITGTHESQKNRTLMFIFSLVVGIDASLEALYGEDSSYHNKYQGYAHDDKEDSAFEGVSDEAHVSRPPCL